MLDNSAHYTRLDTRRMMPALGKATMAIFTWSQAKQGFRPGGRELLEAVKGRQRKDCGDVLVYITSRGCCEG